MKYSDSVNRAFRSLKVGALWGFTVGVMAAMAAVYALIVGGAAAVVGVHGFQTMGELVSGNPPESLSALAPLLTLYGAFLLAAVLSIPLSVILHGGLVSLSDGAIAGRPVRATDGWKAGARNIGRVLAIDLSIGLVVGVVLAAVIAAIVAMAAGAGRGSEAGLVLGICCGLGAYLMAILAIVLLVQSYEALAVRYGVIGGRTFSDAMSAAGTAFKMRWKNVVVFALLALGLRFGFQLAVSAVTVPLEFLFAPSLMFGSTATEPTALFGEMARLYAVLIPFSILVAIPWNIFVHSLWTAFFRQLTGLDIVMAQPVAPVAPMPPVPVTPEIVAPAEEPASPFTPPTVPYAPQPPAAPQPPIAPQPPAAPEPPVAPQPPASHEPPGPDA